jgi:predicted short-subunit dehydrogenase-like oxidoreductase (DUF2520 family)
MKAICACQQYKAGVGRQTLDLSLQTADRGGGPIPSLKLQFAVLSAKTRRMKGTAEILVRRLTPVFTASVILPGMSAKPRIAIVGAGNLASALAGSLRHAAYRIDEVLAHSRGASLNRAKKLAKEIGARAPSVVSAARLRAGIIWFCVPDAEIARAARAVADRTEWAGKVALHSSGALTSDELEPLRRHGAAVASVHPMMTFVRGSFSGQSKPSLAGVPCAIEGDAAAVRVARRMVKDMGGRAFSIRKADKAAYHAWGTFASPLLTALLATTERVATLAGVSKKDARRRMIPILSQTLANYASFGAAGAFSGPIVRGDVDTVKRHLRVLRRQPALLEVYVALARMALRYLPAKKPADLKKNLHL